MSKENKQKSGKKNKRIENIEQSSHLTVWTSVGMKAFRAHVLCVTDNQLLIWNRKNLPSETNSQIAPLLKGICRIWNMTASLKVHWFRMTLSRDGDWRVNINWASHRYASCCREERCGGAGGFISANLNLLLGCIGFIYSLRWVDYGALTSVINAVQVFTKTIRAQSISNFAGCQPSIMGRNVATKAPAGPLMSLCSTVRHRCWEVTPKRGRATTLHTLIGINTKFGDGTSAGLQESGWLIMRSVFLLSLLFLVWSLQTWVGHF